MSISDLHSTRTSYDSLINGSNGRLHSVTHHLKSRQRAVYVSQTVCALNSERRSVEDPTRRFPALPAPFVISQRQFLHFNVISACLRFIGNLLQDSIMSSAGLLTDSWNVSLTRAPLRMGNEGIYLESR